MNFDSIYIDKLMDNKHIFVFDSKHGQIVYHRKTGTRSDLIKEIKEDLQAQKLFDSWLFSMQQKKQIHYANARIISLF